MVESIIAKIEQELKRERMAKIPNRRRIIMLRQWKKELQLLSRKKEIYVGHGKPNIDLPNWLKSK